MFHLAIEAIEITLVLLHVGRLAPKLEKCAVREEALAKKIEECFGRNLVNDFQLIKNETAI